MISGAALSNAATAQLVEELENRPGVRVEIVDPYREVNVSCTGPVVVLIVED